MATKKEQVTQLITFKLKVVEDRAAAMEYGVKLARRSKSETGDKKKTS